MALEDLVEKESCPEDMSDKILSVKEALRLHSGIHNVRGIFSSISSLFKMVISIDITCPQCKHTMIKLFDRPINLEYKNKKCNSCNSELITDPKFVNAVSAELNDPNSYDDLDKLKVLLFEQDTNDVEIGEDVIINGEIHVDHNSKRSESYSVVYTKSIEYINKEQSSLTKNDIDAIIRFKSKCGNSLIKRLVSMTATPVIGYELVKEGLLLSAASTKEDHPNKRMRIHILLVGPPGLAKTAILQQAAKLVPRSTVESGQSSSGLSLTAMVVKEDEKYNLRIGPVPRSRGAFCGINELNRMSHTDQDKILDIMQEGFFTINKYGIKAKIRSPTTILATANPRSVNWESDTIDMNQVDILAQLRDRFDLKFIFKRKVEVEEIRSYAYKKGEQQDRDVPDYSSFIKKYITYSKEIEPKITEEAKSILNESYVNLTRGGNETPRSFESLYNLARARARLKLKFIVDAEDAKETIEFYNNTLTDFQNNVETPENPRDVCLSIMENILMNSPVGIEVKELCKMAGDRNQQVKAYLGAGLSINSNYKVRTILDMLSNHSNIKRINEKPVVLTWFDKSQ